MGQATLSRRTRHLWLAPIAGALVACAAQVEEDYRGGPMAKLQGAVAALDGHEEETELSAAIVWMWPSEVFEPRQTSERVAVEGAFPAGFSLTLYEPPPPEAEVRLAFDLCLEADGSYGFPPPDPCPGQLVPKGTRTGMWIGVIAAIGANTPDGDIELSDIVGLDTGHLLFYFDSDRPETLPEDATAEQIARHRTNFGYDEGDEAGYHLAKIDPEWQRLTYESYQCQWEGLCVHWTDETPRLQDRRDWEFEHCVQSFPENPTCSALMWSTDDEEQSSIDCRMQYGELQLDGEGAHRDCGFDFDSRYADNPEGLADPLMIELGMQIWDMQL